jgi:hypothetical protein
MISALFQALRKRHPDMVTTLFAANTDGKARTADGITPLTWLRLGIATERIKPGNPRQAARNTLRWRALQAASDVRVRVSVHEGRALRLRVDQSFAIIRSQRGHS